MLKYFCDYNWRLKMSKLLIAVKKRGQYCLNANQFFILSIYLHALMDPSMSFFYIFLNQCLFKNIKSCVQSYLISEF